MLASLDGGSINSQKLLARVQARVNEEKRGTYDFAKLTQLAKKSRSTVDAASFVGPVEVRESKISGRGMFTTKSVKAGELLLCEKPLAYAPGSKSKVSPSFTGLQDNKTTHGPALALFQDLAFGAQNSSRFRDQVFSLFDGNDVSQTSSEEVHQSATQSPGPADADPRTFDVYKALSIIENNGFWGLTGNTSDWLFLKAPANRIPITADTIRPEDWMYGLWHDAAMLNHSCVGNASWAWVGELLIIRATRDIQAGEEITHNYLQGREGDNKRQAELKKAFGFQCGCALCQADNSKLTGGIVLQYEYTAQYGPRWLAAVRQGHVTDIVPHWKALFGTTLAFYDCGRYKNLPYHLMATALLHLGHALLGDIEDWPSRTIVELGDALACFQA